MTKQTREQAFAGALKFTQEKFDEGFSPELSVEGDVKCHVVSVYKWNRRQRRFVKVEKRQFRYE